MRTRKVLIKSVANMTRVSLHNYKIVGKNQFQREYNVGYE
jgi:hypothetical protein